MGPRWQLCTDHDGMAVHATLIKPPRVGCLPIWAEHLGNITKEMP